MGNLKNKILRFIVFFAVLLGSTNNILAQCSPLNADDTEVCDNTTLHAPNPAPNTGLWTTTGNANIVSPNNQNTVIDNLDFGPNTFIWTVAADNCSDSIVVQGIKIPVDAGADQPTACSSTSLNGSNPSPGTGKWTCSSAQVIFDDATSPTATVSNLPIGDVTFIWTVSYKGCDNSDTMVVTNNTPNPVNAGADDEACSADSIQLAGTIPPANCHGKWTVLGGTGTFANDTLQNTWVSGLTPNAVNVYRWRVYNDYCENSDTVEITDNSVHLQDFTSTDTVCTDAGNLSVTCPSATTYDAGQWKVIASTGTITSPNNCNTAVTGLNFDANTFRYVATKGSCVDSVESTIVAYAVVANASADASQACQDSVNLYVNDPASFGGSGVWSVSNGSGTINSVTSPTTYVTGLNKSVTNVFTWTVTKGSCVASDSVSVDYNEPDDAIISNGDTGKTCNNAYVLTAVAPTSGSAYWTSGTSGVTYNPNANSASVTVDNLAIGNNTFIWHVENGTCPEKTDTILIINQFPPNVDAGGPYDTVCNGEVINLAATLPPAGGTGLWTAPLPITFDDATSNTAQASNIPYGASILTWTVTVDQCSTSDTVTVYSNQSDPAVAQSDFTVCSTNATISATPITNGTGLWTSNDPSIVIDNPTSNSTDVHKLANGGNTFYWTVTNGACSVTDTLIVYNDSVSVANAGVDQYICSDSSQLLGNTPTLGTGQWTLVSGGANIDAPTQPNTWTHNLARGENIFIWQISQGACSSQDTVSIFNLSVDGQINQNNPQVVCTDNSIIVGNNPVTQDIPNYPAWGVWSVIAGSATIDNISNYQTNARNLPLDTTLLVWTMKNAVCSSSDTLSIVNNSPSQAYAGQDTILCSSTLPALSGNTPIRGTGQWIVLAGGATITNPTQGNSSVTNLDNFCGTFWTPDWWTTHPAPNIFEWEINYKGCTSTDTVRVINGNPRPANAGIDDTVCSNETNLNALDQGDCSMNHWWESVPSSTIKFYDPVDGTPDNTDYNAHVDSLPGIPPNGTTSSFIWHKTNTFGSLVCELTDTVKITSLGYEEQLNAGNDDAVCNTNYKLSATPPDSLFKTSTDVVSGYWTLIHGDGDFDNSTLNSTFVRNMDYQTNIYRWTVVNETKGCEMNDDVYITNALPSQPLAGPDTVVCEDRALLTATRPVRGNGVWTVLGGGSTIVNPSCQTFSCNTYANNLGPGINTFLWTVTNTYTGPPGPSSTLTCALTDTLTIDNRSIVADAGNTIYICADTAQLNANQPTGTTGSWLVAGGSGQFASTGGNTSTLYNDVVRNLTRGKNTFTWTIDNGTCNASDNLIVWDNLPNPNPNAGADQTICADSTTLAANSITRNNVWYNTAMTDTLQWGYSTQEWTSAGGGNIISPVSTNTWVKTLATGNNYFIWHAYYHFEDKVNSQFQTCELTDTVLIYNNAVTASAGSSPPIQCGVEGPGAQYQLNAVAATAPNIGFWTAVINPGPSTIVTPSAYNSWVTGMQNGNHIYQWNVQSTVNGVTCSASDTVVVKVRIPTTAVVSNPDSFEVCINQADLVANSPTLGTGSWEDVYGGMGTITDPNSNNTTVTALWPGKSKWAWVINNDGCKSLDTITVINNTVVADADDRVDPNIQNICVDTFSLSATDPNIYNFAPPYATGAWTGVPAGITFDNNTIYNTTVRNLSNSQSNILRWTITKGGCSDVSQLVINNNFFTIDADVSSANNHMYTCADSIQLAGEQPGAGTGLWNLFGGGGKVTNDTLYNSEVNNLPANDSYLEWTVTKNGCVAKDTVIVTNNMISANAGVDDTVCFDTTSLAAGPTKSPATGNWTAIVGGAAISIPSAYNSHVSSMSTDLNQFVWTVTKGVCTATDTVNIINNAPDPAVVENDKEVCSPTTSLTVTIPPINGTGIWTLLNGGGNIVNPSLINATVNNLNPGKNTFLWTVTKGACKSIDSLNVTNDHVVSDPGQNDTVCTNSGQLFAVDPSTFPPGIGTGVWSEQGGGGTVDNSTLNNTTVSNLGFGTNRFRWTVTQGGCVASNDVLIINRTVTAIASDISECTFPVTLTGNNPVSNNGLWKNVGGYGTIANPTLYNSTYDGLNSGLTNTLRWTVFNSSCADSVDISVTNNSFVISAGPNQTICTDTAVLNADVATPGTGYWSIPSGSGTFDNINDPKTTIRNLAKGINVLQWNVSRNGCSNAATVTITNNSPSQAIITGPANTETCVDSVTLTANHPTPYYADNQYWTQVSGSGMTSTSAAFNITVKGLAPGNNVFVWTIDKGACSDVDTITITNNMVAAEAGLNDTICSDSTFLNATDPLVVYPNQGTGYWTNLSGPQSWIADSSLLNTKVSGLPNGTSSFQWNVKKGNCIATDIVQITNRSIKAVASDISDCTFPVTLTGNDPGAGNSGLWKNIGGNGTIATPSLYNSTYDGLNSGLTNTLRWRVSNSSCADSVDINVTNNSFVISAGPNQTICTDTAVLNADAASPGTGFWSIPSGSGTFDNSTDPHTIIRNLAKGNNVLQWNVTRNGCSNTAIVTITNNSPSQAIITGPANTETCVDSVILTANHPTPYYATNQYWQQISGSGMSGTPNVFTTTVNGLAPGNNVFVWKIENGACSDADTITITNNMVASEAGTNDTICSDNTYLNATDPLVIYPNQGTGYWTNLSGPQSWISNSTLINTQVTNLANGTNTFQWTVVKGNCSVSDIVQITNSSVKAIANDVAECDGNIQLNGNDPSSFGGTGAWSIVAGTGSLINPTLYNTSITGVSNGSTTTLQWLVSNGTCSDSLQIGATNNGFTISAGSPQVLCADSAQLSADAASPGTGVWKVLAGSGNFVNVNDENTVVKNLQNGNNIIQWIVTRGSCKDTAQVSITNSLPSSAQITGPGITETCVDSVILTANHPTPYYATNQYWQQISGSGMTNTSTAFNITVNNLAPGNNVFIWTVENGTCNNTDTITITNNQVVAVAGINDTICSNNTYLNATDPTTIFPNQGTGYWTNLSGAQSNIIDSTLINTQVVNLATGTNSFQWTVVQGNCSSSDIVQITNKSVNAVASDIAECDGDIQLNGNDPASFGGTGLWKKVAGTGIITTPTLYNTNITGVALSSSSTLQWRISNGTCADSIQIKVSNNNFYVSAGVNDTICADSIQLNAQNPGTGTGVWNYIAGNADFNNSTLYNTVVKNLGSGKNILTWTITNNSCSSLDSVIIMNNSPSIAKITGPSDTVSCDGSVSLTAEIPINGTGHWQQISGTGMTGTPVTNPITVNGLSPNGNLFAWVVENGKCIDADSILITNNLVQADAGTDDTACVDSIQLHAVDPATTLYGGTGHWVNLSGSGVIKDINNPTSYVTGLPNYSPVTLQWVVEKGKCSATSNVNVLNYSTSAVAGNQITCDSTAKLTANAYSTPTESGYWSIGAPNTAVFVDNPSNNICNVANLSTGANQFTWHVENSNCADSATIFVTNNGFTVSADASGSVVNVCSDTYKLSADNPTPGTGLWTEISGPGIVTTKSLYNSTVTGLSSSPTLLQWDVNKQGCSASDQVSIINNSIKANASAHLYTCDGTVTLDGNNPNPGTGIWTKVVPTASGIIVTPSSYNTQINTINKNSTIALRWTITSNVGACKDSVQILVTNNDFDLSAGLNDTTCSDSIELFADSPTPGTGYWKVLNGAGIFDNSTNNNTIVRNIGNGDNIYTWNVTKNGCTVSAQDTITNNSVTAFAGLDQLNLCTDNATLSGNDVSGIGGTGYWKLYSGGGTIANSTQNITTVTGLSRNDNTFRWTVSANGCTNYDDVILRNNSFDVDAGLPQTLCADTAQLNAIVVAGGTGTWSPQGGTPATIDNPNLNNTIVRGLQQGTNTFRWSVTKNGCTFNNDVAITNDLPNTPLLVSSDDTVCVDSVQLQAVAPETGVVGTWSYTGTGGTISDIHNNNTWAKKLNYGNTVFIWTVKHNACELSDNFTITNDGVTSNAGGDQQNLCQNFASLNAVKPTAPATGWWTKADAQPNIIANSLSNVTNVTDLGYGENKFIWNVSKGICNATDTVIIINNSASPAQVGSVPPTCNGIANLSATPPLYGSGNWSYTGTYAVNILNSTNNNTQVTNLEYGANLFTWTVSNTTPYATCSNDTSFFVVNNQFTVSAGNDQILCDSITHLEGETRPNQDSAVWTAVTNPPVFSDIHDPNTQIIIGQGQSTVLRWTVYENGCSDNDLVTIQNKGVTAIAYNDEVCSSSTTLNAVPPTSGNSGYWTSSTPSVTYSPDNSTNNATVYGLNPGANLFTWHLNSSNCSDSTTVKINYLIPYADAGPSVPICETSHVLSANDPAAEGGTGVWSIPSGAGTFSNSTAYNSTVSNIGQGSNTYRWTVSLRGCTNSSDVVITNNRPNISVGGTQNICTSSTILTGNKPDAGNQGIWTEITANNATIIDSTLYNTEVKDLNPGTYIFEWTVSNAACTATEQLMINNNSITADAGSNIPTCVDSVRLAASLPPNSSGYWSSGIAGPVIQNSTLYNTWVTNLNADNNLFTWTVSANGCSGTDNVIVTNNSVIVDAGKDQNICSNQTTLFGSNTSGGAGLWTRESGSGIFTDSTTNVTVVQGMGQGANVFKWTVTRGMCSGSDEVIINNNEVYADAGSGDNSLCATEFNLNAIPPDTLKGETGYWSVYGGAGTIDQSTSYNTWVRSLARGENILRWTIQTAKCSNYDEIKINNITPSKAVTAPDREICENYTTITANAPVYGVGNWEKVSGPSTITFVDSTLNSTEVDSLGTGPNKFAWVITDTASGCSTSDTIMITNSSTTAFAGLDKEICTDTFKLEASEAKNGNTGRWTKISSYGTFDNATINNTIVRNMGKGPNTYRWTIYSGICSATDEVIITNNTPTTADAGNDQISCDGTATLVGTTPDLDETGLWSKLGGNATIDNTTRYWTNVNSLSNGDNKFTWMITRGKCNSIDTVVIKNNKISVYAGGDQEVCSDSTFLSGTNPNVSGGTGVWQVTGGAGVFDNSTNYETAVTGLAAGLNTFKWLISQGACSAYDEVQITNNEPTDAIVCKDTVLVCTDYVNLCANMPPSGESGYWQNAGGGGIINDSTDPNTSVSNLSYKSTFAWTIQKGSCIKTDTMLVINGTVDATVSKDTIEVCDTIGTLSANNPLKGQGTWTFVSGSGVIDTATNNTTIVRGLSVGANTFRWTVVDGSCSASDDMVLLDNKYPVTANMAGTNPICSPEIWVIGNTPIAGAVGTWSFFTGLGGAFDDIHSPATRAYNIGQGVNTARWTITKGACSNSADFVINNQTISAQANSPIIVCSTTDTTSLVANDPSPGTGKWTLLSGTATVINSTLFSTLVTGVGYGSNSLQWTVTNGSCSDSAYVVVQNNFFTVSAGTNRTICDTTTVLSGTNPGTTGSGFWTVSGGQGSFDNPSSYSTRVNGLQQGDNSFTWSVSKNGCSASNSVVITNGLPYALGGGDKTTCSDSVILSASKPSLGTGAWSLTGGSGNIITPSAYNSHVRNLGHGQNTLRWTVTNGQCKAYDDITVYNYSVLQKAGDDQYVCDTFTTLAADPPGPNGSGYWTKSGGGGVFVNPTLFNTKVYGVNDGTNSYTWNVTENGCKASSTVQVISNRFDVNAGADQLVSANNTTLSAVPISGTVGTWTVAGGAGTFNNANDPGTLVTNLQYGVNTYRWTVYNSSTGCSAHDDVDITYNGLVADAGPYQIICADSTYLNADPVYNGTTYWTIDLGSCTFKDVNDPKTLITNISRGQNIFRWNVSKNGFTTSDTVSVYNYNFSVYAGADQYLCSDTTLMQGTGPQNTNWKNDWQGQWIILKGGGTFSNQNDPNASVSYLAGDTNVVQWNVTRTAYPGTGICRAIDTVNLIYYKMPATDFVFADGIGKGCSPLDETFINTTPATDTIPGTMYRWNFADQGEQYVNLNTNVSHVFYNFSDTKDTSYTVSLIAQVTVNSGITCTDTVKHDVTVWAIPHAELLASPVTSEYPNSYINIENKSSQNANTYSWDWGDTQGIVDHSYISTYSHYYNSWGDYLISVTIWNAHNCVASDSQWIHIIAPVPTSKANNNVEGCTPLEIRLYGNVNYITSGKSQYRWIVLKDGTDDTVVTFHTLNPIYNFRNEGTYFAKFWATGQGSNPPWSYTYIRTDTIVVYPVPIANFDVEPRQVMAPEQPIHCYDSSKNAVKYLWDFGLDNHTAVSSEKEPIYFYTKPGEYTISLQVWTSHGCTDKKYMEVPIIVLGSGDVKFPNAFAPESIIKKNKIFKPAFIEGVKEYDLQIYNRWGELIFESKDPDIGWDGTIKGVPAVQDVYVYKCQVTFKNGIRKPYTGSVTLLR